FVLDSARNLRATNAITIPSGGRLITRGGTINAPSISISSGGVLVLDDLASDINALIVNSGTLNGDGAVDGNLINNATGAVSVDSGKHVSFSGALNNSGSITLADGRIDF